MGSHGNEELSQDEVCIFCGDRGFSNAIINCSDCCETLVHQYCLGIPPGSIDDSFNWLCEFCCEKMESEPHSSDESSGTSIKVKGNSKKRKRERERQRSPENLLSEIPLTLGSKCKRIRKERTEDQSLAVTTKVALGNWSCGKDDDQDMDSDSVVDHKANCSLYCDGNGGETLDDEEGAIAAIPDDGEHPEPLLTLPGEIVAIPDDADQPEPLLTLLPIAYQGSEEGEKGKDGLHLLDPWEVPEGAVSSLMENPEELMRGVVLLVSPSGETFIHEDSDYCDGQGVVFMGNPSGEVFMDDNSGCHIV